jgi:cell wall-associated NlpC family hydrolase
MKRKTTGKQVFFILIRMLMVITVSLSASGCSTSTKRTYSHSELGNRIVSFATQYEGAPYRKGGTTPEGFDCSGFTSYVFKKIGITIPRTVGLQYSSGIRVARSDLMKGDLIFFTRWSLTEMILPPEHVGIYLGDDRFIHAPSTGAAVKTDSLNNPYWKARYKGARDVKSL